MKDDTTIPRINRAISQVADRTLLAAALITIACIQIIIAEEVLSDTQAADLTTMFELGFVTIGPFDIVGYMILIWLYRPLLSLAFDASYSAMKEVRA